MISFWHLTAIGCLPAPNVKSRLREKEIFRKAYKPFDHPETNEERRKNERPAMAVNELFP